MPLTSTPIKTGRYGSTAGEVRNGFAFAALRADGSVVTWGDLGYGGDSSAVASQLNGSNKVVEIFSTSAAFAALRADGSVVTWGQYGAGGNSSAVASQLNGSNKVVEIYSTDHAFAALRADGSVVTWGGYGGDSSGVASQLNGSNDVVGIFSTDIAFAALRADGSVVTWGESNGGGDSSAVAGQLNGSNDVVKMFSTLRAFAALRADGSVVTWGNSALGGNSSAVASQLNGNNDVVQIASTYWAFAALRADGSVVTWGDSGWGGDSSAVASQLNGNVDVTEIFSTGQAFAALRADGSVVTWGDSGWGGDSSAVASQLNGSNDVVRIVSTYKAFAALRADGSVVTWGDSGWGGDSSAVASQLNGSNDVVRIFSTSLAFAALRADGSVVTWGDSSWGGDSGAVASQLNGVVDVVEIFATGGAFAALRVDGSMVTWGSSDHGGNSSAVASQLNGTIPVVSMANAFADDEYTVSAPTLPDLVVQATLPATSITQGSTLSFSMTISNIGTAPSNYVTGPGIRLDSLTSYNGANVYYGIQSYGSINPGQFVNFQYTLDTTNLGLGQHTLFLNPDENNWVTESDEVNNFVSYTFNVVAANRAPVVNGTGGSLTTGQSVALSTLFSATDPDGNAITAYRVYEPNGVGYLSWSQAAQVTWDAATRILTIPTSQLSLVTYYGETVGSETLQVAASDGSLWSSWTNALVNVTPANRAPVVNGTGGSLTAGQSVALSTLFSATDPDGNAITAYRVYEPNGVGYLSWSQAAQVTWDAATRILTIPTSQLSLVTYYGETVGSETLQVAASDGSLWSSWANALVNVTPANRAPVVNGTGGSLTAGQSVALSTLFSATDPDGNAITAYRVYEPNGVGYLSWSQAAQVTWDAATRILTIPTSQLSLVTYYGETVGSETLQVAASDGSLWSSWANALVNVTPAVPVNRPPVLDASRSPALTAIAANATSPTGNTVAQIVVDGSITDPDVATAPEAIVVENVSTSLGTWQYSTNGGSSWSTISGVAAGHGLALDANALVRLLPNGTGSGQATFTFRAWDKSVGTSGAYLDYTAGSGAVSATSDTASIAITGDTTPPSLLTTWPLDNAANVAVGSDLVLTLSEEVQAGTGNVLIYNANGTLWRSLAIGDTSQVTFSGSTVTINPADNLTPGSGYYVQMASGVIKDVAGNNFAGLSTATAYNFSTADALNHAPVLDASRSPTLTAIAANATSHGGNTVAQIVMDGSITDPDVATAPEAIVIENVTTSLGTWQCSTNGGSTWQTIAGVSAGHGLALGPTALIRLLPNGSGSGTATFTFRAWDQTVGTSGTYLDYTAGSGAVSAANDTAAISVTATGTNINTTPTANALNRLVAPGTSIPLAQLFTYWDADSTKGDSVVGFAVKDQTSGGGYLTLDGVRQSELTTFGNTTLGIPIAQIGRWAFVAGPAGSTDSIGFSAIDTHGAFNNPVAISKVTSSQPIVATVDAIQNSIASTTLLTAGTINGYIDQDDLTGASIDIDYYKVSLVGGHRYSFLANANANSSDTLDSVTIRLRDAFGNVLQPRDYVASGGSPTFDFIAPGSGSLLYYLAISAGTGNGAGGVLLDDKTGQYQISLVDKGQNTSNTISNNPLTSSQTGIDYRYHSTNDPLLPEDINDNFGFIGHYIGSTGLDPSYLSPDKVQLYKDAGLRIFSIYEKGGMDKFSYFTLGDSFATGRIDGFNASNAAKATGQTEGSAIYFGIDDDPGYGDINYNLNKLKEYFKGINQGFIDAGGGIPRYTVGIYGAGASIEAIKDVAHLADYGWLAQAMGWTGSKTYNNWDIKQVIDKTLLWNKNYFPQTKDFSAISYISRDETQGRSFGAWGDLTLTTDSVQHGPVDGLNSFLTVQASGVSGTNVVAGAQGDSLVVSNGATGNLISQARGFIELLFNGGVGQDVFTVGPLAAAGIANHTVFFNGLEGNDILDAVATDRSVVASGGAGDDILSGGQAVDLLTGDSGADTLDGGAGLDTAVYSTRQAAYTLTASGSGYNINGPDGADTLTGIERLNFLDAHLGFDVSGNAGQIYRLYKAAFARVPDLGGLGYWIARMDDASVSLEQAASGFIASAEFQSLYGANPTHTQFITALYLNVMERVPEPEGLAYWLDKLNTNELNRAQVLLGFSESPENKDKTADLVADGILYVDATQAAGPARGQLFNGTAGADTLIGSVGADTLDAGAGDDRLLGGAGNDSLMGGAGDDSLIGGGGIDIAVYAGTRASHTITVGATGLAVSGGADGGDSLLGVERLKFDDGALALDIDGNAGQVYRLYQAAFDRTPDTPGLSYHLRSMDAGLTLQKVTTGFIASAEFQSLYGANPTNAQFIDLLYANVLNRAPDPGGYAHWNERMNAGETRELVLIGFSESPEYQAAVLPTIQGGIAYAV